MTLLVLVDGVEALLGAVRVVIGHELNEHVSAGRADRERLMATTVETNLGRRHRAAVENAYVIVVVVAMAERVLLQVEGGHVQVDTLAGRGRQTPRAPDRRRVVLGPARGS